MDELEILPIRLTKHFRSNSDLDLGPLPEQFEGSFLRRLDEEVNSLRFPSWKILKRIIEDEAISKVTVREALQDFYALAGELTEGMARSLDEKATILFHLLLWKMGLRGNRTHSIVENHIFGSVSSLLQHRAVKIMKDIMEALNEYTIHFLGEKITLRKAIFGEIVPYESLKLDDKQNLHYDEMCNLNFGDTELDIIFMENEVVQQTAGSGKEDAPEEKVVHAKNKFIPFLCFDNGVYEEIKILCLNKNSKVFCKVFTPQLKVNGGVFRLGKHLDTFEMLLFPAVFLTKRNLLISLPLSENKMYVILLSILNMLKTCQVENEAFSNRYKVLYLASREGTLRLIAGKLEKKFGILGVVTKCLINSHSFNEDNLDRAHIILSTYKMWDLYTRSRGAEPITNLIRLLLVDEVTSLEEDDCGPFLEALVTRIKAQARRESSDGLRIVGLTMTPFSLRYSDTSDMARFLNVDTGDIFLHSEEYAMTRNISLMRLKDEQSADLVCYTCVASAAARNMKVIVFVRSAKEAEETAHKLFSIAKKQKNVHLLGIANKFSSNQHAKKNELLNSGFLVAHSLKRDDLNQLWKTVNLQKFQVLVVPACLVWEMKPQPCCVVIKEIEQFEDFYGRRVDITRSILGSMVTISSDRKARVCVMSYSKFDWLFQFVCSPNPIGSKLKEHLVDVLNAEIVLGKVQSLSEAIRWLEDTYLYLRMKQKSEGQSLDDEVTALIKATVDVLRSTGMIQYLTPKIFISTELGHISSSCNVGYKTVSFLKMETDKLHDLTSVVNLVLPQLNHLKADEKGKDMVDVGELIRRCISHDMINMHHLWIVKEVADQTRALFLLSLSNRNAVGAQMCLTMSKILEQKCWKHPNQNNAQFEIDISILPIDKCLLLIVLELTPQFKWNDTNQSAEYFWVWIEDKENNYIHNYKQILISRKQVESGNSLKVTLPLHLVSASQQFCSVRVVSNSQVKGEQVRGISLSSVTLPYSDVFFTDFVVGLQPLPVAALNDESLQHLYSQQQWDPIISQVFHSLYHAEENILLAGRILDSQKTIAAELAILHALKKHSGTKIVYIAMGSSQVRRRYQYWQGRLPCKITVLTADRMTNERLMNDSDVLLTTADNAKKTCVQFWLRSNQVSLLVIDDVEVMEPAIEVLVAHIVSMGIGCVRLVGLSNLLLSSAQDVAQFLCVRPQYLYSFPPSPSVKLSEILVYSFVEKSFTSRMNAMNGTVWYMVTEHCPPKHLAVIVVPSRKQLLLTATDLRRRLCCTGSDSTTWSLTPTPIVQDSVLQLMLSYGIGLLHFGLRTEDYRIVEELMEKQKIKVAIITANVARCQAYPCHLIILKGTQQYNEELATFVDYSMVQVSRMISPSHTSCLQCKEDFHLAVILTDKANVTLYESYFRGAVAVESLLLKHLTEYLNIEIAAKRVCNFVQAERFLSCTYLAYRLTKNPSYYFHRSIKEEHAEKSITYLVHVTVEFLVDTGCIKFNENSGDLHSTLLGKMAMEYKICQQTLRMFITDLEPNMSTQQFCVILCRSQELRTLVARNMGDLPKSICRSGVRSLQQALQYCLSRRGFEHCPAVELVVKEAANLIRVVLILCADRGWLESTINSQRLLQMLVTGIPSSDEGSPFTMLPHMSLKLIAAFSRRKVHSVPDLLVMFQNDKNRLNSFLGFYLKKSCQNELYRVLNVLPTCCIALNIFLPHSSWYELKSYNQQEIKTIEIDAGLQYTLNVGMCVDKISSWTVILACTLNHDVVALKHYHGNLQNVQLLFTAPCELGTVSYMLYILSDQYIGLDQQYKVQFKVQLPGKQCSCLAVV